MKSAAHIAAALVAATLSALALSVHGAGTGRAALPPADPTPVTSVVAVPTATRIWEIEYRAHNGATRAAHVLLPSWYGPERNPELPLVISPHGRGVDGLMNARLWGNLPAIGGFAVVSPDGHGRLLGRFSWGAAGQIDDLARMPDVVSDALPWLRIDRERVYAAGGSMGGQETLLLVARHPELLAGAIAVDSLVDFTRQYGNFPRLSRGCNAECEKTWGGPKGERLQWLARREVGGSPETAPAAYAERSPLTFAAQIASSGVPLQLWWSRTDAIVVQSRLQSGLLAARIREHDPNAPLIERVGSWRHTETLRADTALPQMLVRFGLVDADALP
jgi:poly(3-hydroxybutyrate) depolymerase